MYKNTLKMNFNLMKQDMTYNRNKKDKKNLQCEKHTQKYLNNHKRSKYRLEK